MSNMEKQDNKSDVIIVAYYLSRCNFEALKELGFASFTIAFDEIARLMEVKPAYVKNVRDQFDPYFDNGRAGWYQRPLSVSRKKVMDEYEDYTDEKVGRIVKKLLDTYKKLLKNRFLMLV